MKRYLPLLLLIFILPTQAQYHGVKPMLGELIELHDPHLVGCWLMNEGGGDTIYDLSGNGNDGTLTGDTHWVPGKYGSCLDFDGDGDYVQITDDATLSFGDGTNDSPFSIVAWVNMDDATEFYIMSKGPVDDISGDEWLFSVNDDDKLYFRVTDNSPGNREEVISDNTVTSDEGTWVQYVATYDGRGGEDAQNGLFIYRNGQFIAQTQTDQGSYTAMHDTSSPVFIGALWPEEPHPYGGESNGAIDNVMIYNRALGADEIQQPYSDPFCMFRVVRPELYVTSGGEPSGGGRVIFIMSTLGWPLLIIVVVSLSFYWIGGRDGPEKTQW